MVGPQTLPVLKLITFFDSSTPIVQAIDCLLMLLCGVYCVRSTSRHKNIGITLLAISCFLSAVILLGFFLSASLLPLTAKARSAAYLVARLLAPVELVLFAIAIIVVARRNKIGR